MTSEEKILRRRRRYFWLGFIIIFLCIIVYEKSEQVTSFKLAKTKGFAQENSNKFIVFEDEEQIKFIEELIKSAEKQSGIVNMASPDNHMQVQYQDGVVEEYFLWVGKSGETSSLMSFKDTHTVYKIPKEMTNQLIDLVKF